MASTNFSQSSQTSPLFDSNVPINIDNDLENEQTILPKINIENMDSSRSSSSIKDKAICWKYMTKIPNGDLPPNRVKCNICGGTYKWQKNGGTGTLTRHLDNQHSSWKTNLIKQK